MSAMQELVERLRDHAANAPVISRQSIDMDAAADAITTLRDENERMREALEPFAYASDGLEPGDYDARIVAWIGNAEPNNGGAYGLHASDFRRARAALSDPRALEEKKP